MVSDFLDKFTLILI